MINHAYNITMELPDRIIQMGANGIVDFFHNAAWFDAEINRVSHNRFRFWFMRKATSQAHAIYTSLKDIHDAVPDAVLIEITPE